MIKNPFSDEVLLPRLMKHTEEKDGHKLWTGNLTKGGKSEGYGRINICGKVYAVHRISAFIFLGLDITDKKSHALHKTICNYKNCWNPEHLYVGNNIDNANDREPFGRFYCMMGHELNKDNCYFSQGKRHCKICALESQQFRRGNNPR